MLWPDLLLAAALAGGLCPCPTVRPHRSVSGESAESLAGELFPSGQAQQLVAGAFTGHALIRAVRGRARLLGPAGFRSPAAYIDSGSWSSVDYWRAAGPDAAISR